MEVPWKPTHSKMLNVWQSPKFCNQRTQIGYVTRNEGVHVKRKIFKTSSIQMICDGHNAQRAQTSLPK
jgi:hypothetical protein